MTYFTHGYIAEIDYTYGFYRELSPALLNYALLLRGYEPPSLDAGFRYCELGFGQGVVVVIRTVMYEMRKLPKMKVSLTRKIHIIGLPHGTFLNAR